MFKSHPKYLVYNPLKMATLRGLNAPEPLPICPAKVNP
jgi:hypothetical protein